MAGARLPRGSGQCRASGGDVYQMARGVGEHCQMRRSAMGKDLDLTICNGLVVAPQGTVQADIGVREGRIVALAGSGELGRGKRNIDASGKWVLPGVIDPHVHFHMWERPFEGDAIFETRAAAAAGVTTIGL